MTQEPGSSPPDPLKGQLVEGSGNIAGATALSLACTAAEELMTVRPRLAAVLAMMCCTAPLTPPPNAAIHCR